MSDGPATRTTPAVARALGVEYRTLQSWVSDGLLSPTTASDGTGRPAAWTDQDIAQADLLLQLRRAGLSMDGLRRAHHTPHRLGRDLQQLGKRLEGLEDLSEIPEGRSLVRFNHKAPA